MDTIDALGAQSSSSTATQARSANSYADLTSEDYFQLLLTQLTNQDPFEPTTNEELLKQISSIRDIEASTSLTSTLERLSSQQAFGSASAMIGQYVTGKTGDGAEVAGVVMAVRFEADGRAVLVLDSGTELPLDEINTVESVEKLGESLIGQMVSGVDTRNPESPRAVNGMVTSVRLGEAGELILELDTGEDLRLSDVQAIGEAATEKADPLTKLIDNSVDAITGLLGI